ncbi:MAG: outer membrane beta-barrel protein [Burkholderiales bacterium]
MKPFTTLAMTLLIGVGLMSSPAMAAGPWYGGANIGQSTFKNLCSGVSGTCDETDTSVKIFAGYRFTPNVSGELGYLDIGKGKVNLNNTDLDVSGNAVYLDAVGNYPLTNNFSLLGRIGVANAKAKASASFGSATDSETKLHVGLGVSYDFSPTMSVRGEWEQVSDFADSISVGLVIKF